MEYLELLNTKTVRTLQSGFDCNNEWPHLKPFQAFCVRLALKKGRFALIEDCGLGKTRQQLTWAHEVVNQTGKAVIVLAPLAVVAQTIEEGKKIGIEPIEYHEGFYTMEQLPEAVYITNYEQVEHINASDFAGIVLDESSILKNFEGAYRNMLIENFKYTQFKLCCTATPSPNDPMELGNHAEFLNVMTRTEMLAMYFVHDGGETTKWRVKGHCKRLFWDFVGSWAIMASMPSDIGFSDEGYQLPPLNFYEHKIRTAKRDNGRLFNDLAISATNHNAELRNTMTERLREVSRIVNSSTESFIVWVKQNEEGEELMKLIPDAVEVKGADSPTYKKSKLLGFANNEFRVLITKTKIGAMGLNFQNCHNMVFAAPDFSFEALYQAIRREWRFGQQNAVNVYLITTDTMENVMSSLKQKEASFKEMQQAMQESMNRSFNHEHKKENRMEKVYQSDSAVIKLGDSIQLIDELEDESIGFSIWSPPFPELYVYSDQLEDLGNCKDFRQFEQFFSFIPPKLYKKMWAGRNVAIHCMDTPIQKGKEGYIGLRDFSGMIIRQMLEAGFIYHSRVTIWKNPVTEMQRTKALGLLHKQVKKDAAMSRVGIPDYLLIFRKPGDHSHPVKCNISVDTWQQYASPVWMDIDYGDTLNYTEGRAEDDEKHICPLQLPTIRRATTLWSNPGDTCLSMFGGVGSEPTVFIEEGRKAIAFELKESYFNKMVKNVKQAEIAKNSNQSLFDLLNAPAA